MTPEEEREHLEEVCVAALSLALHLAENARDQEATTKLSPYAQSLLHGIAVALEPFRQVEPPSWVKAATKRLSAKYLGSLEALVNDVLAKKKGAS